MAISSAAIGTDIARLLLLACTAISLVLGASLVSLGRYGGYLCERVRVYHHHHQIPALVLGADHEGSRHDSNVGKARLHQIIADLLPEGFV